MNFKKTAIASTLALLAGNAVAQQQVNPEGTGQVLLYPFYNVSNDSGTYVHVTNTTDSAKAVKIRFMEHKNSAVVLEFNSYIGAKDIFAMGVGVIEGFTAVYAADESCTVPRLGTANAPYSGTTSEMWNGATLRSQPFVPYLYDDEADDGLDRLTMGHIEVIEMGVVAETVDITDCDELSASWSSGGDWNSDSSTDMSAPTGGLYGYSLYINPSKAYSMTVNPTAIDGWAKAGVNYHTGPGALAPNLDEGSPKAMVYVDGEYVEVDYTLQSNGGILATSAALAASKVSNEVLVEDAIAAETDWVLTFPTKKYFTSPTASAPFTEAYDGEEEDSVACEAVDVLQYDREANESSPEGSFVPEDGTNSVELCNAVTVVSFYEDSAMLVEQNKLVSYPFQAGWSEMSFSQSLPADDNGVTVQGLPVVGFAGQRIVNGPMSYGNAVEHKTMTVTSASS